MKERGSEEISKAPRGSHVLHAPQVGITHAALSALSVAFPLATPDRKGHPAGHACSRELPPRSCLVEEARAGGHTHPGTRTREAGLGGRLREALTAPSSLPGGPGFGRVLSSSLTWGSRQRSHSEDRAGKLSIKSTGGKPPRGHSSLGGRGPVCSGVLG